MLTSNGAYAISPSEQARTESISTNMFLVSITACCRRSRGLLASRQVRLTRPAFAYNRWHKDERLVLRHEPAHIRTANRQAGRPDLGVSPVRTKPLRMMRLDGNRWVPLGEIIAP